MQRRDEASVGRRAQIKPVFDVFFDWLSRQVSLRPDWTMLEIGVGPNGFAPFYAPAVGRYIGLDIDDYSGHYLDVENTEMIIYDGRTIPLPDQSVDIVVTHSVFEHVLDVPRLIQEANRVLVAGGLFYLTINPLYFSSWGSHGTLDDHVTRLPPWEHLNPASPHYLTDCPPQMIRSGDKGCYLNKMTVSQLLAEIGRLPWSILRFDRAYENFQPPPFALDSGQPIADLTGHDIRLLVRKDW